MKTFSEKELNDMLEAYQSFVCNGITIDSLIHKNGPDMCRQLLRLKRAAKDFIDYPRSSGLQRLKKEIE